MWLHEIHNLNKYKFYICNGSKVMANVKVVWPKLYIWSLTLKNDVTLHFYHSKCAASWDAHVHKISNVYLCWIKCYGCENGLFDIYFWTMTFKDDLDLDKLPLKMCGLSRCICMPNIKSLSVMAQKWWPVLKLSSNKQTDRQTNKQTDRAKTKCPPDLIWGA